MNQVCDDGVCPGNDRNDPPRPIRFTYPESSMEGWGPELALILGLVEGLTEFLPVSSTGHLILVGHFLGFTGEVAASIDISIQLGSVLAIVAYERAKLASLCSEAYQEQASLRHLFRTTRPPGGAMTWQQCRTTLLRSMETHKSLWFLFGLGVAFCPAAIVGLLTYHWIKAYLFTPQTVAGALILGGIVILLVEARPKQGTVGRLDQIGITRALLVGLAQCCSLFPGVSRSGSTIIGGMLAGMDRKVATEFSFFLALPTMLAATTYQLIKGWSLLSTEDTMVLGLGLVTAFFVAWAVIAALLAFVKSHSLRVFAYYRIILGLVVFVVFR